MSDPLDTHVPAMSAPARALDLGLTRALTAPPLPIHFHERLLSVTTQPRAYTADARRKALEEEYEAERKRLRDGQVHLQRETAAVILGCVFAAGACMHPLLQWIHAIWGVEGSTAMPVLAAVVGLAAGTTALLDRFGHSPSHWVSGHG